MGSAKGPSQASFDEAPVLVQHQYYVSTGYNAEQAIVAFPPVDGGTLVIYTNHTSTDQVAGPGGGAKRTIGRRVMAGKTCSRAMVSSPCARSCIQ